VLVLYTTTAIDGGAGALGGTAAQATLARTCAKTPLIMLALPQWGNTAGGTALAIAVADVLSVAPSVARVTISCKVCTVSAVSITQVERTTSSYGTTSLANRGLGPVELVTLGVGSAAAATNATYEYIGLWCSACSSSRLWRWHVWQPLPQKALERADCDRSRRSTALVLRASLALTGRGGHRCGRAIRAARCGAPDTVRAFQWPWGGGGSYCYRRARC